MRGTAAAIVLAVLLAAGCESPSGEGGTEKAEKADKAEKGSGAKEAAPSTPENPWVGTGFAVWEVDGRWWVFKEGSKENADFVKGGEPAKSVTRIGETVTWKAVDAETLDAFEAWKPGFAVRTSKDGRIWIFKAGAKELAEFAKGGELAKHVTRIGAGPKGATIKGPDAETLDAWAAVK